METMIDKKIIGSMAVCADKIIGKNSAFVSKSRIKDVLLTRKLKRDLFFWNNGALSWALGRYEGSNISQTSYINNRTLMNKRRKILLVDNTLYFYANYNRISRKEKEDVYNFLQSTNKDSAGSVMYRQETAAAFLDTIGMICPFLARYGSEYGDERAIELAMQQFRAFFKYGFDEESGLPYHGYDIASGQKCGIIGWGRGLGWLMIGLVETLRWLDPKSKEYVEVKDYAQKMFRTILKYQMPNGGLSWQLQAREGHLDTSVVAMVGYSLCLFEKLTGGSIYKNEIEKMVTCLISNINKTGAVLNSSAECRGFSMYPQRFEVNSWGQGFGLLFLVEYAESSK